MSYYKKILDKLKGMELEYGYYINCSFMSKERLEYYRDLRRQTTNVRMLIRAEEKKMVKEKQQKLELPMLLKFANRK